MKKLLIIVVAMACTLPITAAEAPMLLKGAVPAAPIQNWITVSDFPGDVLEGATVVGPANFALTISDKGRVIRCTVERSSGSKPLDETACYIFEKRGRFRAATDGLGKPAIGIYRVDALWAVTGQTVPARPLVEMAVELREMPQPLPDPAYVDIAVSVDTTGRVDGCVPAEALDWAGRPVPDNQAAGKVLGATACAEAVRTLKLEAGKNSKGKAVRSVQMATSLFTANASALVASATPTRDAGQVAASAPPPPPAPPADPKEILVEGRNIKGLITRPEAKVPFRGFEPFIDFEPVGPEVVLLKALSGKWYRATLEPPCIGSSRLTNFGEGIGVELHPDGSVDFRSRVFVKADDLPIDDGTGTNECRMISLVDSAPPKGRRQGRIASWALKPPPPILPVRAPIKAPDGGIVYPVDWQERPSPALMSKMSRGSSGSGWIMCQTAANYKVRKCKVLSQSPKLSGIAPAMRDQSGNFRVRPPIVDGRPLIGAWVAIGFDFYAKRTEPVPCNPSSPLDPC